MGKIVPLTLLATASFILCAVYPAPALVVTNATVVGNYNCEMTGGVGKHPFSRALMQVHADGKGNISSGLVTHPGVLTLELASFGTEQTPAPGTPAFYFQQPFEICKYSMGVNSTYNTRSDGEATMAINWVPDPGNQATPVDCTLGEKFHYAIIVNSATSFSIMSSDLKNNNCATVDPLVNCGSSLAGTCQLQH